MSSVRTRLSTALAYTFNQPELLDLALTHRSAATSYSNERLEFLGDALLNLVIADYLYQHDPHASEGMLSRLRAVLVKGETLAALARDLGLGESLHLGADEIRRGVAQHPSVLADAFEAVLGAVYLDGGWPAAQALILRLYQQRLEALEALECADELKGPKNRLQEYLQARQQVLPRYSILAIDGEPHAQLFTVECAVGERRAVATGSTRRQAEQDAARQLLEQLGL